MGFNNHACLVPVFTQIHHWVVRFALLTPIPYTLMASQGFCLFVLVCWVFLVFNLSHCFSLETLWHALQGQFFAVSYVSGFHGSKW
jgi:hypothetical protein